MFFGLISLQTVDLQISALGGVHYPLAQDVNRASQVLVHIHPLVFGVLVNKDCEVLTSVIGAARAGRQKAYLASSGQLSFRVVT